MRNADNRLARCSLPILIVTTGLSLSGCGSRSVKSPASSVPSPPTRSAPVPPAGAVAGLKLPEANGDGGFKTANTGISAVEAVWHVRSALNVAALACDDRTIVANYNALLKQQKGAFAAAYEAEARQFRTAQGNDWRSAMDGHMTRLYNFFAQPSAQRGFCAEKL
jgi:hypothetical protein